MNSLLITNIGTLATPAGTAAKSGGAQGEIHALRGAWILIEDGVIAQVGTGTPAPARPWMPAAPSLPPVWWTPTPTWSSAAGGRTSWG